MMAKRLIGLLVLVQLVVVVVPLLGSEPGEKVKVAEGQYVMEGKVNVGKAVETLRYVESWNLWRLGSEYEAEGEWELRLDSYDAGLENTRYRVRLNRDLHPILVEIFAEGPPKKQRRTMTMELLPKELRWQVTGEGVEKKQEAKFAVESPYDVFWPFSWIFSSLARRGRLEEGDTTSAKAIFLDDDDPIDFILVEASIHYLGEEEIEAAGQKHTARKFRIESSLFPMMVWTLENGVLAVMEDGNKPEQRMELVRYEKYAEFGPGVK
jgi:hypothetical protein